MKRVKVSTYAKQEGVSVQTIYDRIKADKVKSEKIDGVTFIILEDGRI